MLIDKNYKIIINPICVDARDIKESLNSIFHEFDTHSSSLCYIVKFKSVFTQYKRHRKDSLYFHNEICYQIKQRQLQSDRKQSKLSNDARKIFKIALNSFELQTTPCEAIDLWAISLKVGQKDNMLKNAIKKLWENQKEIKRLSKETKSQFDEFYKQLHE
ncbi:hypothetical protein DGG96_00980 [Legionella qingyii]|uniref:Uncharacterized protein n=1 Tax=Legionella qingyii TaxID=2184757 RepID=A0A317U894_9GAMM|nr:hypothetical protein [Legionella qingyii]PWY57699.1 hypothetical protein DGG96_00980 [Legionella qingyii]RUR25835.1 hypothetical protein ELY20_01415 [Legionella qingyii]RUR29225.1 hypothetical protein ELY16_00045 [Legionella qingyii]